MAIKDIQLLNKPGIYKILNNINGKFYIGSAARLKHRINNHKSDLRLNKHINFHLQSSWNKHTEWNFEFIVLEYCEKEKLIEREQYYIDNLKPEFNILKIAYSSLGKICSEETKIKIGNANRGRIRPQEEIDKIKQNTKGLQNRLGHKATKETKHKMSLAQQARQGYKVYDINNMDLSNLIIWKGKSNGN